MTAAMHMQRPGVSYGTPLAARGGVGQVQPVGLRNFGSPLSVQQPPIAQQQPRGPATMARNSGPRAAGEQAQQRAFSLAASPGSPSTQAVGTAKPRHGCSAPVSASHMQKPGLHGQSGVRPVNLDPQLSQARAAEVPQTPPEVVKPLAEVPQRAPEVPTEPIRTDRSRPRIQARSPDGRADARSPGRPQTVSFSSQSEPILRGCIKFLADSIKDDEATVQRMSNNETFQLFREDRYRQRLMEERGYPLHGGALPANVQPCGKSPGEVAIFVLDILSSGKFSVAACVHAVFYISHLKETTSVSLHILSWRLLFFTSLLLADKWMEDTPIKNSDHCKLFPVIKKQDLDQLEEHFFTKAYLQSWFPKNNGGPPCDSEGNEVPPNKQRTVHIEPVGPLTTFMTTLIEMHSGHPGVIAEFEKRSDIVQCILKGTDQQEYKRAQSEWGRFPVQGWSVGQYQMPVLGQNGLMTSPRGMDTSPVAPRQNGLAIRGQGRVQAAPVRDDRSPAHHSSWSGLSSQTNPQPRQVAGLTQAHSDGNTLVQKTGTNDPDPWCSQLKSQAPGATPSGYPPQSSRLPTKPEALSPQQTRSPEGSAHNRTPLHTQQNDFRSPNREALPSSRQLADTLGTYSDGGGVGSSLGGSHPGSTGSTPAGAHRPAAVRDPMEQEPRKLGGYGPPAAGPASKPNARQTINDRNAGMKSAMGASPGQRAGSDPAATRGGTSAAKAPTEERRAHTGTRRPLQANAEPPRKVLGGNESERAGQSRLPQGGGQAGFSNIQNRFQQSLANNFSGTQPSTPSAGRPVAVPTGGTAPKVDSHGIPAQQKGVRGSTLPASTGGAQQRMPHSSGATPPQARPMQSGTSATPMQGQQPWLAANRVRSASPSYAVPPGGGQYPTLPQTARYP